MVIDNIILDDLTEKAKLSRSLRMIYDLRDTPEDNSQRILNALEPNTVVPIHRHTMTSEDVIILRGRAEEVYYDNKGIETGRFLLTPGGLDPGSFPAIHVPKNQYHTCQSLESGTVIIEFKNTKYDPDGTEVFLKDALEKEMIQNRI